MRIEVLGPCRVIVKGVPGLMPQGPQGLLLQMLLLRPNDVLKTTRLIGALWP